MSELKLGLRKSSEFGGEECVFIAGISSGLPHW